MFSLKLLKVAGATVFDRHVSPTAHAECCCSSSKHIKNLGIVVERLERRKIRSAYEAVWKVKL
ncbi:hypothetical protein DPMN_057925 [Dreissena polymorpha]|uniref:Uncharacterized protein n=1 Tax=Dreissena polymorpha TaxID=45954 RepID=A0A9D4HEY7_DREPO|nr:hypothetical protein DPMN_057925 [Dreissena polymorpha]